MKNQILVVPLLLVLLSACAADVVTSLGVGAGGGSSSSSASTAGAGGSAGTDPPLCVVDTKIPGATMPTCADLAPLSLEAPKVVDDSGDGIVTAGEGATITLTIRENSGIPFNWYPGILFTTDNGAAAIDQDAWLYAIAGCQATELSAHISFSNDITKGTIVNVKAMVGMLNAECLDTASVLIPIEVF